jgi:hypothetical protein
LTFFFVFVLATGSGGDSPALPAFGAVAQDRELEDHRVVHEPIDRGS